MEKKELIIIILFAALLLISLGFNYYQYQKSQQLRTHSNSLEAEKGKLEIQYSILLNKTANLNSKISDYLEAQGKNCNEEIESCLEKLTEKLKTVTGPDCSTTYDGICPDWCVAGSDYDCCIEAGLRWIQGRGCYS